MNTRDLDWLKLRLRELVPELASGDVEIKGIAREPGVRTIIAVTANTQLVDAVGAFVGVRACRIKKLVRELDNEKVDLVLWCPRTDEYIIRLLSPLKILHVDLRPQEKRAAVYYRHCESTPADAKRLAVRTRLIGRLVGCDLVLREV